MATEIELKAHIQDSEAMRLLLYEKAEYIGAFEKDDTYWFSDQVSDLPSSGLRVRREKRSLPDGTVESVTLATYKIKEVRDGIEINDEREFEIRSLSCRSESEFEEFLRLMGFKPGAAKKKRGWAFSGKGISAELAEVEGLGWFVELEILANGIYADGSNADNRDLAIAEGKKRLLDFLAGLGVEKEAIESRYYTEMLRERKAMSMPPKQKDGCCV